MQAKELRGQSVAENIAEEVKKHVAEMKQRDFNPPCP